MSTLLLQHTVPELSIAGSCVYVDHPSYVNIRRYYKHLSAMPAFEKVAGVLPAVPQKQTTQQKDVPAKAKVVFMLR